MLGATILQSQVGLVSRASRGISTHSRRNFLFARKNSAPTPWFVDEDTERSSISVAGDQSDNVNLKNERQMIVQHSPPPPINAPNHLRVLHAHLITLPLLDSVSVVRAKSSGDGDLLSVEEDSLPTRRPHGRRKRGGSSYGGDGVGDPPPVWEWVLEADVKEGAEKRGAVEAVLRSATKALAKEFPEISLPTKAALHAASDGWGFLDFGDFALHILSRDAKKKWFAKDPQRTFARWY